MQLIRTQEDRESLNIVLFAVWALLEALQLLVVVVFIFSFIPIKAHPFVQTLFTIHQKGVLPEREMFFYRLFVFSAMAAQGAGLYLFRKRLQERSLSGSLAALAAVNLFWLFVQIFCVFKIIVTQNPAWARYLFYAGLAGAVLTRVFWSELLSWHKYLYEEILQRKRSAVWARAWDLCFLLLLVLLIFVPDLDKVLSRMFVRDQFYHIDSFLMAPAWARLQGLTLNLDAVSSYSMVIPAVFSFFAKFMGGVNYHTMVALLITVTILYYAGFYFFLRQWLGSLLMASCGVLLAVKLQMFHWGVSPIIWQFPSATVVRYIFDLPVLWLLWQHCQNPRLNYLWAAGLLCGVALAWMQDTGIYLLFTFYAYMTVDFLTSGQGYKTFKDARSLSTGSGLVFAPIVMGFFIVSLFQGPAVLSREFWTNSTEFVGLFLKGWGALPMYDGLKERQFFAFIMGFIIPVIYVGTLIFTGTLCFIRKIERKNLFVPILCIYGLGLYHYFINRSAVSSYYVVCIPFVAVVCFWFQEIVSLWGARMARNIKAAALAATTGALMTSYLFTYYPNVFNLANSDWEPEKKAYKEEFNFEKDAELIRKLTGAQDRVALISSFETKILLDAGRKPFFYYFPLVESNHMKLASFRGTYLHTYARMQKTIAQLQDEKPEYIFIEKKLFRRQLPKEFYQYFQTLNILVSYLEENYVAADEGLYLMAVKRKP